MIRLEARGITKRYGTVSVLREVDFAVHAGAVNALLGENGAGKSTLMKIIAGVERHDGGQVLLDGAPVTFRSVQDASARGVGIVHQELSLCPNLTVAENVFLDRSVAGRPLIDHKRERDRTAQLLARLGAQIDPDARVAALAMGDRQIVEIARALSRDVSVLILDEPTSALSTAETDRLFAVLDDLRASGVGIIYISHRMQEIARIADHVTVLRDGRSVAHAPRGAFTIPWVVRQMVGRYLVPTVRTGRTTGAEILALTGVIVRRRNGTAAVDRLDLSVRAGEVTALYGLLGAGRTELLEAVYGVRAAEGEIRLEGRDLAGLPLRRRAGHGVGFVTEDRQQEGVFANLDVRRNVSMPVLDRLRRMLLLSARAERAAVDPMLATMRVKTPSPHAAIGVLSGGNQQKVLIARALLDRPRLLMLDEPGRGVDIAARAEIFEVLRGLAAGGAAILFATSDLIEATTAADRVVVMAAGRITGDFTGAAIDEAALVQAANDLRARTGHAA